MNKRLRKKVRKILIPGIQPKYSATKSFFLDDKGHGESQFVHFYSQYNELTQNNWQVMSIRKD